MEKKKLLLIAISVGIFLVFTIGAALLVFTPKKDSPRIAAASSYSNPVEERISPTTPPPGYQPPAAGVDAFDLVRKDGEVPGLQSLPEETAREGDDFHIRPSGQSSETVISVTKPKATAVPDTPPAGKAAPSQTTTASRPQAKPTQPTTTPTRPSTSTSTSQAQQPTKKATNQNDFWVQTGAFSTITKAEGIKATLASKGITSIIENRELNGATIFRVRVGPYTSQNEANYWLSLIKSINGFEDSQIRQTQARR